MQHPTIKTSPRTDILLQSLAGRPQCSTNRSILRLHRCRRAAPACRILTRTFGHAFAKFKKFAILLSSLGPKFWMKQGKAGESRRRKATGLRLLNRVMPAGLPRCSLQQTYFKLALPLIDRSN